jgi:hypothetical protein
MSRPHFLVDGVWVDLLFPSADLSYSTGWYIAEKAEGSPAPSGDLRASIRIACDRNLQASWTMPGKTVRIYSHAGGEMWGGLTSEPSREENGITIHAEGRGAALAHWQAVYDTDPPNRLEMPTYIPNDAVDYAITRGAPFTRNGVDLGTAELVEDNDGPVTDILTLLTRAAIKQGKRVHVDSRGAITYRSNPTTATWWMTPQADYFGTADEQFVSLLRGYFEDKNQYAFVFEFTGNPTGGTLTLSVDGVHTATPFAPNASTGTIQTAVRTLGGIFTNSVVSTLNASSPRRLLVTASGPGTLIVYNQLTGGTEPGFTLKSTAGRGIVWAEDTTAAAKYGNRQVSIDLLPLGPITRTEAQTYITNRFALVGGRMGWTTQVELNGTNLLHSSGVFVSPRYVKAGDMLLIPGIIDARSDGTIRGPVATVTPVGFVPRDFSGLLAPPEKPADTKAA